MSTFQECKLALTSSISRNEVEQFIDNNFKRISYFMIYEDRRYNSIYTFLPFFSRANCERLVLLLCKHNYASINRYGAINNILSDNVVRDIINKNFYSVPQAIHIMVKNITPDPINVDAKFLLIRACELIYTKSCTYLLNSDDVAYISNLIRNSINYNYYMVNTIIRIYRYIMAYESCKHNVLPCDLKELFIACITNIKEFDFNQIKFIPHVRIHINVENALAELAEIIITFSDVKKKDKLVAHLGQCGIKVLNPERLAVN